jgi:1,4-alpha-glucan branching enzyme
MIKKEFKGKKCKVTFEIKPEKAEYVEIIGSWNNWQPERMKKRRDGTFYIPKTFDVSKEYEFRYIIDGKEYINDPEADGYIKNPFGTDNCIVKT